MTGTHIMAGRAAGLSFGYTREMAGWIVIVTNMSIETFLVLIVYPMFVFSYRRLIIIEPLPAPVMNVFAA